MKFKSEFGEYADMMKAKYDDAICGISNFNNVDKGVAFDMLVYNYRAVCKGEFFEVKKGGGVIDYAELGADIKKLDSLRLAK